MSLHKLGDLILNFKVAVHFSHDTIIVFFVPKIEICSLNYKFLFKIFPLRILFVWFQARNSLDSLEKMFRFINSIEKPTIILTRKTTALKQK